MKIEKVIPVLRIFDYPKALEFYRDWLGFTVDWEHQFEPDTPRYLQVTKGDLTIHLSEHHGDGSPGQHLFVWCSGLKDYQKELISKGYRYGRPGLEESFYDSWSMTVHDPFGNRINFNEKK